MAQKWNSDNSNVFGEYRNNILNSNSSHDQSVSVSSGTMNDIHSGSVLNQVHDSQQAMVLPSNTFTTMESSISTKGTHLSSINCNVSHNNSSLFSTNSENTQQVSDDKIPLVQEDAHSPNMADCFICCSSLLDEKNSLSLKSYMNHSHAPLLVLLTDVLGYKLDNSKLHSQVVCKSCYHLLDIIDELQQTLTESKTNLRTKFLETIHRLKLKYPRTDKMLKPRCLRCVHMTQSSVRKRPRACRAKGGEDVGGKGKDKSKETRNSDENDAIEEETNSMTQKGEDCEKVDDSAVTDGNEFPKLPDNTNQVSFEVQPDVVYDTDPMFFSPDERLKAGIRRENEDGSVSFFCSYCGAKYEDSLTLRMHVRVYHMPVLVYDNGQGISETRHRMGIKVQNMVLNDVSTTNKPYVCLFCTSAYKLQSSLQFHFRENHSPYKPHQCIECKESFRRTIELSRHRVYRCSMRKLQAEHPKR